MISSGIKRGIAASAISALAVAGLPLFAGSASATPLEDVAGGADQVVLYAPDVAGISAKNDGTNTTVSLVAGGGEDVTNVLFQYSTDAGVTWIDVPGGNVARGADGAFGVDWTAPPATTNRVRAVAGPGGDTATATVAVIADGAANTVELATEGALGVFQSPYDADGPDNAPGGGDDEPAGDYLAVNGTTSATAVVPTVSDASHGTAGTYEDDVTTDADGAGAGTTGAFSGVLDIDGYDYSAGAEVNQIALNAATSNTDDAEASTLYIQTITSITATPATQNDATQGDASSVLTVLDGQGNPVGNAQVFSGGDTDTDGGGTDSDVDGPATLVGYTNGLGEITVSPAVLNPDGNGGTETYYVNTTDDNARNAGDPSVDVTVNTAAPVVTTVEIVNERDRSNFDNNEIAVAETDDFTIVTNDQFGNPVDENIAGADNDIEYRYTFNPDAAGADVVGAWTPAETDANGEFAVPGPGGATAGTYTLEARRPNVAGTGLVNATPEVFEASQAAASFDEGDDANAPVNGDVTVTGNLSNIDGPLAGREVELSYAGAGDSDFAPQSAQPAGTTLGGAGAFAVTDANGDYSVVLRDPAIPANVDPVEEFGILTVVDVDETAADTTSLAVPAEAIQVNFIEQQDVTSIDIDAEGVLGDQTGPGRPVGLDIQVFSADEDADGDEEVQNDFPITVEVDKGFLTPFDGTYNDSGLTLAEGQDDEDDLWGFFENDGTEENITTGDDGDEGFIAGAIERDEDFDADGLVEMTVTVTAGDMTETATVTMDARDAINVASADLPRDEAAPTGAVVPGEDEVDLNYEITDQYGNLSRVNDADVTDDSTVADFTTENASDSIDSDYDNSGVSITAFSTGETVQTLMAMDTVNEWLVDENGDLDDGTRSSTATSDPIVWAEDEIVRGPITGELSGKNTGKATDKLKVTTKPKGLADGARVNLFKFNKKGVRVLVESAELNDNGIKRFQIADKNGRKFTKYVARIKKTDDSKALKRTNFKRVR